MRPGALLIALLVLAPGRIDGQDWGATIGSLDGYLMDEPAEVALAKSAAPAHVAASARVLVLARDGYREAAPGRDGFTCLVERSWSSPIGPHRDFFNPALRAPICYNSEAARTVLGDYLRRTELALAGRSIGAIRDAIEREIASGALPAPRGMAMSYMLSGAQRLGTETGRFKPHLMFYIPYATSAQLGSPPPGCEHVCVFEHDGGPFAALVVPVEHFNEVKLP